MQCAKGDLSSRRAKVLEITEKELIHRAFEGCKATALAVKKMGLNLPVLYISISLMDSDESE